MDRTSEAFALGMAVGAAILGTLWALEGPEPPPHIEVSCFKGDGLDGITRLSGNTVWVDAQGDARGFILISDGTRKQSVWEPWCGIEAVR
jgi:hypothetical protein